MRPARVNAIVSHLKRIKADLSAALVLLETGAGDDCVGSVTGSEMKTSLEVMKETITVALLDIEKFGHKRLRDGEVFLDYDHT